MTRIVLSLTLVLSAVCLSYAQNNLKVGSRAPQFSVDSVDGKTYDLTELRGSVVVLTFWSTRCIICQAEMPKLDRMIGEYKDRHVVFLAATPEDDARVKYYLSLNTVKATVLPNSFGIMLNYADRDRDGTINIGYPAFFVIDGEGTVQYRGSGYSKTPQVAAAIEKLLTK